MLGSAYVLAVGSGTHSVLGFWYYPDGAAALEKMEQLDKQSKISWQDILNSKISNTD